MSVSSEKIRIMLEGDIPEGAEEVSDEQGRKVFRTDREFYKVVAEQDIETLKDIYNKLGNSRHTPETDVKIYPESEQLFVGQKAVEQRIPESVEIYGLDHVVEEVIQIYQEFIDRSYVPKELNPKDIRFDEDANGVLIDYLDTKSVGKLKEQNMTPSSQTAFNIFVDRTSTELEENDIISYKKAYSQIVEKLREEADYITIMGHNNNKLHGLITYNGPIKS